MWKPEKGDRPINLNGSLKFRVREFFSRVANPVANERRGFKRTEGDESFWGLPLHPFLRTLDVVQTQDEGPMNWWSNLAEMMDFYNKALDQAGEMVKNTPYDEEIWVARYGKDSPKRVIAKHGNDGGIKALKTVHRIRPGELWRANESKLRHDEVPVLMLVHDYGNISSRVSFGAWEGNTPLVLISDEPMQHVLFDTSFVEATGHHPKEKLGFRITPGKNKEVWAHGNLSTMSAQDPVTPIRLHEIGAEKEGYRNHQIIEVCDLARVVDQNPHLMHQISQLSKLGHERGGVGMAATMTPADVIAWSERGTHSQKEFLNIARFVVGTVLDSVTATQLGKTLAPRVWQEPEELAEKLLYTGGSQVAFVDDGIFSLGWLIG